MTEDRDRFEARLRALADAGDLAALATEVVRGYGPELLGFLVGLARWESSLRVWAYRSARHLFIDSTRARAGDVPLSAVPEPTARMVRTTTAAYRRTEVKDALAAARARLDPEEQMLLGLRVEGEMGWRDIARVLGHAEPELDRHAAALRKRFERLKARLHRALAGE